MSGVTVVGTKVIVVGGGLAGLSAAHSILEKGGRVLLLDKKEFLGGNSTKATSGINGAGTSTQRRLKIEDTAEAFEKDTWVGGKLDKSNPLMKVLTHNSASAVEWLINNFGLDLSLVSRLGGHSFPRTHRGGERFPGMTITYALMEKMEEIAKANPDKAQVLTLAKAIKLTQNASGEVVGLEFERNGQTFTETGPVILATGGFGADFGENSLLKQNRPDLMHLPTTNGDHCTGDGIKMTLGAGGSTVDMTMIQVHPTGMVLPSDPDNKVKWLAAEALRGVGGMLIDAQGKRFANELGTRDYVTGEMWKNKGPFRLLLNAKAVKEIEWHCKHYVGRGLMKKFNNIQDLAKEMKIDANILKQTFDKYNQGAASNKDEFGKKYFSNTPFGTSNDDAYHVSIVTPVVHYCMGGIQIDANSSVLKPDAKTPIAGLWAAGETAGGVHGKNRLGGSGLLGCVVYGRVAGDSAAKHLLSQLSNQKAQSRLGNVIGHLGGSGITIHIDPSSNSVQVSYEGQGQSASAASQPTAQTSSAATPAPAAAPAAAAPAAAAPAGGKKEYTLEEVSKHNTENDCWLVVNGEVLNATSFLDRHPGGKGAIMLYAGKEASEEFNMLHKPDVIVKYAPEIIIGTCKSSPTVAH